MKKLLMFCFVSIACSSHQETQKDLTNTKWVYDYGDDYKDFYLFLENSSYKFYSAETGDTLFGKYNISGDTIHINQEYGFFDDEFPEGSRHRTKKLKLKMLFKNDIQIEHVERWESHGGKWVKSDVKFDKNYVFTKR